MKPGRRRGFDGWEGRGREGGDESDGMRQKITQEGTKQTPTNEKMNKKMQEKINQQMNELVRGQVTMGDFTTTSPGITIYPAYDSLGAFEGGPMGEKRNGGSMGGRRSISRKERRRGEIVRSVLKDTDRGYKEIDTNCGGGGEIHGVRGMGGGGKLRGVRGMGGMEWVKRVGGDLAYRSPPFYSFPDDVDDDWKQESKFTFHHCYNLFNLLNFFF